MITKEGKIRVSKGDRLIAVFMGLDEEEDEYPSGIPDSLFGDFFDNPIKYRSSWNWLMPVAIKCKDELSKQVEVSYLPSELKERYNAICAALSTMDIVAVYDSIVYYIKWYNNIKEND